MGDSPRHISTVTGSMLYPYWQLFFTHVFNSQDEYLKELKTGGGFHDLDGKNCPFFYAYGADKPIMFHTDKWIDDLKS